MRDLVTARKIQQPLKLSQLHASRRAGSFTVATRSTEVVNGNNKCSSFKAKFKRRERCRAHLHANHSRRYQYSRPSIHRPYFLGPEELVYENIPPFANLQVDSRGTSRTTDRHSLSCSLSSSSYIYNKEEVWAVKRVARISRAKK